MPCNDGSNSWGVVERPTRHGLDIDDFEAVLCGVFTELDIEGELYLWLGDIDWKEVGVSRAEVETWWTAHKKEDEARRDREQAERDKKALKASALAKLTDDEKKVLGL